MTAGISPIKTRNPSSRPRFGDECSESRPSSWETTCRCLSGARLSVCQVGLSGRVACRAWGLGTKLHDEQDHLSGLPLPARDHPAHHLVVLSVHAELA